MNDLQLADDFLKVLKEKTGYNGTVQVPINHISKATTPITIERYDVSASLKNSLIKSMLVYLKGRIATKYEYERIRELMASKDSKALSLVNEENRNKLLGLTEGNGKQ